MDLAASQVTRARPETTITAQFLHRTGQLSSSHGICARQGAIGVMSGLTWWLVVVGSGMVAHGVGGGSVVVSRVDQGALSLAMVRGDRLPQASQPAK